MDNHSLNDFNLPNGSSRLDALWEEVEKAASTFIDAASTLGRMATFHDPTLRQAHDRLGQLFLSASDPDEITYLLLRAKRTNLSPGLSKLQRELHLRTEIVEAEYLAKEPVEVGLGSMWVTAGFKEALTSQARLWEELGLSLRSSLRPVYVVGGGALPQSQKVLNDCTGRRIISIERDQPSVDAARMLISAWGHTSTMPVLHTDGALAYYTDAAAIVIATLVEQKEIIVQRVSETAPSDVLLSIRIPTGLNGMWRTTVDTAWLESHGWRLRNRFEIASGAVATLTLTRSDWGD